ncbi:Tim44/TimA family putative adaptor protein [Amorphus orientalis]|uniref:Large ribosomal subunit protein mL45 n=1 Tax=Amorphus orientalis TaxID=649198 RepID=A0AAE4AQ79_9HYPH|nr:Tim44/TimA family putative adaptor protein [Amorphus orientalis]MDQ0313721.1 putative lipid-binding transport protein (Tim44 family) [Amorphus orientalis]
MSEFFDIYNVIFLALAVAIFLRLRSVLGRRTGNERRPFDPYSARERSEPAGESGHDNVVTLPRPSTEPSGTAAASPAERIQTAAKPGTPLYDGLSAIAEADASFEPKSFLEGARAAYEMIVTAFADGDRKALTPLLSKDVLDGFVGAIDEREKRQERVSSTLIGIEKAEISDAALKDSTAQVTVRFESQMISATYDAEGAVIDGDPNKVVEVTDIWTFARDVRDPDPNWKLVATESA